MKTATAICEERLYRIKSDNNTEYYIRIKKPLSVELTNRILKEDTKVKRIVDTGELYIDDTHEQPEYTKTHEQPENTKRHTTDSDKMSLDERINIFKNKLPSPFGMYDFIKYLKEKGYSDKEASRLWSSTIQYFRNKNLVNRTQLGHNTKYEIIQTNIQTTKPGTPPTPETVREIQSIKKVIEKFNRQGKDFTRKDIQAATGITDKKRIHYLISILHKNHFIVRANPDEHSVVARWVKGTTPDKEIISDETTPETPETETPKEDTEKPIEQKPPKKIKLTRDENILKAKDYIKEMYKEGKDWSTVELSEATGIDRKLAYQIVYHLSKTERYIVRSNPEERARRKFRWVKTDALLQPSPIDKEYMLQKLQEERKVQLGLR